MKTCSLTANKFLCPWAASRGLHTRGERLHSQAGGLVIAGPTPSAHLGPRKQCVCPRVAGLDHDPGEHTLMWEFEETDATLNTENSPQTQSKITESSKDNDSVMVCCFISVDRRQNDRRLALQRQSRGDSCVRLITR